MRAFGAPIRDACADGGGIPRVVAETIAWLDAHGARAFPSDPPTARGVARGCGADKSNRRCIVSSFIN